MSEWAETLWTFTKCEIKHLLKKISHLSHQKTQNSNIPTIKVHQYLGLFCIHNQFIHVFCIINWKAFLSNYKYICAEIFFYFADQKVVTENPIRTTRFASITTPLPVRKNDKFADSGEGLVYDLGNYVFFQNLISRTK